MGAMLAFVLYTLVDAAQDNAQCPYTALTSESGSPYEHNSSSEETVPEKRLLPQLSRLKEAFLQAREKLLAAEEHYKQVEAATQQTLRDIENYITKNKIDAVELVRTIERKERDEVEKAR